MFVYGTVLFLGLFTSCFFLFQAEDGIRDLVRSRGLGDVYKRQFSDYSTIDEGQPNTDWNPVWNVRTGRFDGGWTMAVSYTHLTLPTSDLV